MSQYSGLGRISKQAAAKTVVVLEERGYVVRRRRGT